jgi:formylmethanofuran dehydrogenase subunit C
MVVLKLREKYEIPIEADNISPDIFFDKTQSEIEDLPLYYGNKEKKLGEVFEVEGEKSDQIYIEGDLSKIKKIGFGMSRGKISIKGNVGLHLGALMKGGEIFIEGNVDSWTGAEMTGGLIRIKGDAGNRVGGIYRGTSLGMNRGTIIVEGNAGYEVGSFMRRGLIVILGNVGDFTGTHMIAGTILIFGTLGARAGAGMRRGTIVALSPVPLIPTFKYDTTYTPDFLKVYFNFLRKQGIAIKEEYFTGPYKRYHGDISELGKGEILEFQSESGKNKKGDLIGSPLHKVTMQGHPHMGALSSE